MLLAAGRGERMGVLTSHLPKPLLPVGHSTLIEQNLLRLKNAGINEVVINLHYLRDQLMDHLGDGKKYGLKINYSIEEELLGTGGGIEKALCFFDNQPFLIMSSDIWTDYPLTNLMHQITSVAHLVLVNNPSFHLAGDYGLSKNNTVQFATPKFTYANFGILNPHLFHPKKMGFYKLTDVLNPAIANQLVTGEIYAGAWFNVGTAQELERANHFLIPE